MCSNTTISVKNVSKCFQMYDNPRARLKQFIMPTVRRLLHKQDKKYYNEFWALNDISFDVKKGETVGIVGRNGSGKSTLLQIICGTLFATHGSTETKGRISALLELGSGFNPDFTGHENIYTNGAVLGMSKEEIDAKYDAIVAFADIGEFVHQPVRSYSSGMYVRLAFSVAIHCDPEILIVDEALAVGDAAFQRKCYATIEKLKQQGCSILFVSHDVNTVISLCDRAVLISHGNLLFEGKPKQVCDAYHKLLYGNASEEEIIAFIEQQKKVEQKKDSKNQSNINDFYIENDELKPQSIIYTTGKANITNVCIKNEEGESVNRLIKGKNYELIYEATFHENSSYVFFASSFKTKHGLELFCPRIPYGTCDANLKKTIRFPFVCLFLPGEYFANVGIWSKVEELPLCRIVDAFSFQVLPVENFEHGGYIDLHNYKKIK